MKFGIIQQKAPGRSAPAPRAANQLIGRHGSPVDFFFYGRACDRRESRSMRAPCAPLLTVPLRPRYATTGATAILARRPGTSTEFVPVVHGTGTLMQGPFETRNTNLGSIMGFREKSNNLYRN